jgi:hypothetical protein
MSKKNCYFGYCDHCREEHYAVSKRQEAITQPCGLIFHKKGYLSKELPKLKTENIISFADYELYSVNCFSDRGLSSERIEVISTALTISKKILLRY